MQSWSQNAVEKWDAIRAEAANLNWPNDPRLTIHACAARCGSSWYESRMLDLVEDFLALEGYALVRLIGFGRVKVERLIKIISLCMASIKSPTIETVQSKKSIVECLNELGVPLDFPCDLMRLPTRIRNHCRGNLLYTLGNLIDMWERVGSAGMLNCRNLGRRSVGEIELLYESIRSGDQTTAAQWLPLDVENGGLSLWAGLLQAVRELDDHQRDMLERRLIDGRTLEESAELFGITRERVRQLESLLLRRIALILEWFPEKRELLLSLWMQGGDWQAHLKAIPDALDRRFVAAALEAFFNDLPQGAARSLEQHELLEKCHHMLRTHPDLLVEGVDLDAFLLEHVPTAMHGDLCSSITGRGRIRLDHASGRIVHTGPRLREVVKAILAREDDPIPLTWLMELLRQTPTHKDADRDQIVKYKAQWKSDDPTFPRHKILWDE